jgi:membrane protein implicated in regulation of membrane protease activity
VADRLCLVDARIGSRTIAGTSNRGDVTNYINATARILIIYLVCMIAGQAIAVGIGLLLDPYSKTLALSAFIPLYYAMYWVARRAADRRPVARNRDRCDRRRFRDQGRVLAAGVRGPGVRFG